MIISDLATMESIVSKRRDLEWNGWDVVQFFKDEDAYTSKRGQFRDGQWLNTRRIVPNRDGWKIPATWVK